QARRRQLPTGLPFLAAHTGAATSLARTPARLEKNSREIEMGSEQSNAINDMPKPMGPGLLGLKPPFALDALLRFGDIELSTTAEKIGVVIVFQPHNSSSQGHHHNDKHQNHTDDDSALHFAQNHAGDDSPLHFTPSFSRQLFANAAI